jgi:hypothetical protein
MSFRRNALSTGTGAAANMPGPSRHPMPRTTMKPVRHCPFVLPFLLGALLPAQQTKTVPNGFDLVEGPSVFTYPFGRVDAGLQVLSNADQVTLGSGVITGIRFRVTQQTTTNVGYTKSYRVTAYTVATNAPSMVADLATNVGTATGTVVFNGPVTLPSSGALPVAPAPFQISMPFNPPYAFNGSQGNLLLLVETTDQGAVSGSYRIDAVTFRNTVVEGIVADVDGAGCTAGGASMRISGNASQAVVGGNVDLTLTSAVGGAFPVALSCFAFDRPLTDLTPMGMPGCKGWLGALVFQVLTETGGSYPHSLIAVPVNAGLEGMQVFAQTLALPPSGLLQGAVTSNALAIRIGQQGLPLVRNQCAFRAAAGWFISGAGESLPIVQLEGVFP